MSHSRDVRRLVRDVLSKQRFCVLATQGKGQPYGSLVAYAETDDLKQMVFATSRDTRKFSNIVEQPRVAMVIDSRSNSDEDLRSALAVTALGSAHETAGGERERLTRVYLTKHPDLVKFVGSPQMAICVVAVEEYIVARFGGVKTLHLAQ